MRKSWLDRSRRPASASAGRGDRDWVLNSVNADKRFKTFPTEQIAGDLPPARSATRKRDRLAAAGILAQGSLPLEESGSTQFVLDPVDDQIDIPSRGFPGLTIACAWCHDRRTDPISQRDDDALAGIFQNIETLSRGRRGADADLEIP